MLPGGILEIGLRVGVIPVCAAPQHLVLTIFLSFTHGEFKGLFKEHYLLYFVQNFAYFNVLEWFEGIK